MTTDFVCEEKHYILVPEEEEQQCCGCAFENNHSSCKESNSTCVTSNTCYIWKEDEKETGT